jgi:hypothetical protein
MVMPATEGQKNKVEKVLHEFKEGDLHSSSGQTVKSRKQAIAIALSESGQSNQQSPARNREKKAEAAHTRAPAHSGKQKRKSG